MKRSLLVLSVAVSVLIAARGQQPSVGEGGERRKVDFRADIMHSVAGQPDSVMRLVGNVVMHHNGAVITCDSAYRFGNKHIEWYGRVLINKDSAYIYGDRAIYDGYRNVADVHSPLVKVIDGEATLYTRNFSFNTLDNVGRFWGGGTVEQKENRLESDRGYYYSDTREFVCVERVEGADPQYKMTSDSVRYNMDAETAHFYTPTTIWNAKGEILNASRGMYHNAASRYEFTRDGYIITATRELWSDSLDYNSTSQDAVMRRNIQIRDEEQKVMAFGDYGQYWGASENGLLTENPSLVTFDPQEDSLYVRSDSMWIHSIAWELDYREYDSLRRMGLPPVRPDQIVTEQDTIPSVPPVANSVGIAAESVDAAVAPEEMAAVQQDSLSRYEAAEESVGPPAEEQIKPEEQAQAEEQKPLSRRELRRMERERKAAERREKREERRKVKNRDAAVGDANSADTLKGGGNIPASAIDLPAGALENLMKIAADPELESMVRGLAADSAFRREGLAAVPDSLRDRLQAAGVDPQALGEQLTAAGLTLPGAVIPPIDTLAADSITPPAAPAIKTDSLQRVILAYRNVRIYRADMQAVCDSMVAFSKDSTAHLYTEPVMWNQQNQITANVIDLFTKNQKLHRAFFSGWPMMVSEVDSTQYNQIKGREMESFFRDNQIFWHNVKGNAQTLYYMIDEPSGEPNGFLVVNSASISFLMEEREIVRMTWYQDPDAVAYPIEKIPLDVDRFLEGFRWEARRRPSLRDVFDRRIRPSRREYYQSLPQPLFPITLGIDDEKKRLIEGRVWEDRSETLEDSTNADSKGWLRSLGFDITGR